MSTLFTAVSVEQQETVAGGQIVVVPDTTATTFANFASNMTGFRNTYSVGHTGVVSDTTYVNNNTASSLEQSFGQTYFTYPV